MKLKKIVVYAALTAGMIYLSGESYKDEVEEEKHYCNMVTKGLWPNYKNLNCTNGEKK